MLETIKVLFFRTYTYTRPCGIIGV